MENDKQQVSADPSPISADEQCTEAEVSSDDQNENSEQATRDGAAAGEESLRLYPEGYELQEADVVCGRTSHPNVFFQKLIREYANEYSSAANSRLKKSALVSKIYDQLVFLKVDETTRRYQQVPTSQARAKIGVAFRMNLSQGFEPVNRARFQHRRKHRLMPRGYKLCDTDIPVVDEQLEFHPGMQILEAEIEKLLPSFSTATRGHQQTLISKVYRGLREQGYSFLHRREREDYRWHQMSQYTSHVEIQRLFQMKAEGVSPKRKREIMEVPDTFVETRKRSILQAKNDSLGSTNQETSAKRTCIERATRNESPSVCSPQEGKGKEMVEGSKKEMKLAPCEKNEDTKDPEAQVLNCCACTQQEPGASLLGVTAKSTHPSKEAGGNKKIVMHHGGKANELHFLKSNHHVSLKIQTQRADVLSESNPDKDPARSADTTMNPTSQENSELEQHNWEVQVKKVERLQQLCSLGDADAQFTLAQCFHDGVGMKPNLEKAIELYCLAAAKFHVEAGSGQVVDSFLSSQAFMFTNNIM